MPKRTLVRRIAVAIGATAAMAGIALAPAMQRFSTPVHTDQALQNWSVPTLMHS